MSSSTCNSPWCSNSANSEAVSATTSSFVTSLVSNIAIAGAEVAAFMIIHGQFRAIYEPRSYMPLDPRRKVQRLGRNVIKVFWYIWLADPKDALEKNGTGELESRESPRCRR